MGIRSITDSGRQLTEADIEALESRLGATLPAPYRAFLLWHNGGRPHPAKYKARTLENFLSIDGKPEGYADMWYAIENLRDDLPDGVIPIAWDVSDDAIVLVLTGENRGCIYLWDHEGRPPAQDLRKQAPWLKLGDDYEFKPDDWPGHPDLILYAANFDEFMESFHQPDEAE